MKNVSMIGCGNLGLSCAEVMAQHYNVVGYDIESKNPSNFKMVATIKQAVEGKDIVFIAVPTPHDDGYGGEVPSSHLPPRDYNYDAVIDVLTEVNKHVIKNQLVVLISTVLTGTIRNQLVAHIPNATLVYNPYLIAMGTVKKDMVNPEMVIVGTKDGTVPTSLIDFYKPLMEKNPRYEIGTWDEAESIKMFYNTFLNAKLSFVNMIQDVAETNGNMNADVVANALMRSTRMISGPGYMRAGMGAGGSCHPRDNIAQRHLATKLNLGYDLFETIALSREIQAERMAKKCLTFGKTICIVGKSYKAKINVISGSPSMLVGHYIEKHKGKLSYYDMNTGDNVFPEADVYLITYWDDWVENINWPKGTTVIDTGRKLLPIPDVNVIHYGNTRIN